jgi:hypothetical protein
MLVEQDDPLFDEQAAGMYLGGSDVPISPRSLQRWRYEGIGPTYIKIGHLIRYRRSALDAHLANCERRPASVTAIPCIVETTNAPPLSLRRVVDRIVNAAADLEKAEKEAAR